MVLGSGIRKNLFRIPDPGVKEAPDPGSGSATLPFYIGSESRFRFRKGKKFWFLGSRFFTMDIYEMQMAAGSPDEDLLTGVTL
jgi:hypothetical protein